MTTAELPSRTYPFLLGGELRSGGDSVPIRSPYSELKQLVLGDT